MQSFALGTPVTHGLAIGRPVRPYLLRSSFVQRATSAGAGLIWGLAAAFLMWLVIPAGLQPLFSSGSHSMAMLSDTRDQFTLLVAYLECLGTPVGLVLGIRGSLRAKSGETHFHWGRAMMAGGFAGLLGGFIFDRWMSAGNYFPLLSGLSALSSRVSSLGCAILHRRSNGRDLRHFISTRRS